MLAGWSSHSKHGCLDTLLGLTAVRVTTKISHFGKGYLSMDKTSFTPEEGSPESWSDVGGCWLVTTGGFFAADIMWEQLTLTLINLYTTYYQCLYQIFVSTKVLMFS